MHIHQIDFKNLYAKGVRVWCSGCDLRLRLATSEESEAISTLDLWADDGPMLGPTNVIVVPMDFNLEEVVK